MTKKRRQARNKRQKQARRATPAFNVHVAHMVESMSAMDDLLARFALTEDPEGSIDEALKSAVTALINEISAFEPARVIEVARLAMLPWARPGGFAPAVEATAAHVELIALMGLAAQAIRGSSAPLADVEMQAMSHFVTDVPPKLKRILELSHLRAIAKSDPNDKLSMIAQLLRGSQVLIRETSYSSMVKATNLEILDVPSVSAVLKADLGFDATDALSVLEGVDAVQMAKLNARGEKFAEGMNIIQEMESSGTNLAGDPREIFIERFTGLFEPAVEFASASAAEVADETGVDPKIVQAVFDRFTVNPSSEQPADLVEAFVLGDNPLRARPLVPTGSNGRVLLPHPSLSVDAVKENLEIHLKTTDAWEQYQNHRGDVLEQRVKVAIAKVLPGAVSRDAFHYYVPADDIQEKSGDPATYTRKVEGDHLIVLDDVALIIEDKAGAVSALSKGGSLGRLRKDLSGIVTKAAAQAERLKVLIERDGAIRFHDEGLVDMTMIREIHTAAVSMDDLMGVTTATAELVRAGLLTTGDIPWTVSLHDLELITQLVDRPAEFLLYLRRRRSPETMVMYTAADELDLFLYFQRKGLWVDSDPDQVREIFSFLPEPSTGERRRYMNQEPAYIASHTDDLDRWFHTKDNADGSAAPKPSRADSPIHALIDELQHRADFGWLSIGAELLAGSSTAQSDMARNARDLLKRRRDDGRGRSMTVPITSTTRRDEAWLLVWATRPENDDPSEVERSLRDYLRTKKHQLKIPRGAVLLYDEADGRLVGVYYDGHLGELTAEQTDRLASLRKPSDLTSRLPPKAKRAAKPRRAQ